MAPVKRTVQSTAEAIVLAVHNGGDPIPPDMVPKLFRPLGPPRQHGEDRDGGTFGLRQALARSGPRRA